MIFNKFCDASFSLKAVTSYAFWSSPYGSGISPPPTSSEKVKTLSYGNASFVFGHRNDVVGVFHDVFRDDFRLFLPDRDIKLSDRNQCLSARFALVGIYEKPVRRNVGFHPAFFGVKPENRFRHRASASIPGAYENHAHHSTFPATAFITRFITESYTPPPVRLSMMMKSASFSATCKAL